ncbi:MAG: hypothetical protein ACRENE_29025, partial [Polyangiaceae bacterium]
LGRLRAVAIRRPIVVAALGVDLDRAASWLVRRPLDAFWLALYDGAGPEAEPAPARSRSPLLGPDADTVAFDRSMSR